MWLRWTHFGVECAKGHDAARGGVVKAAAFDTAHVDIALIHERLDEERQRLAAGQK